MWVVLYVLVLLYGHINDDINLYSLSFFLLSLAGLEFSFGLLLVVLFKTVKAHFDFTNNDSQHNQFFRNNVKKLRVNKYM